MFNPLCYRINSGELNQHSQARQQLPQARVLDYFGWVAIINLLFLSTELGPTQVLPRTAGVEVYLVVRYTMG